MKKRRLPSLRRAAPAEDGGVGFEDLPPDERGSEIVMHPSPGAATENDAADDDTKPRPSLPASAVVVHEPGDAAAGARGVLDSDEASDYLFRPPTEADDPDASPATGDGTDATEMPAYVVPDVVVDDDIRAEVLASTAVSTFVEGPPGAGISTLLAERVVAAIVTGAVAGDSLAVVTRDSGRASQERDRLRDLMEAAAVAADDDVVRRRLGAAVTHLRTAPVGPGATIAAAILRRWPEAAGIAPGFTVVAPHAARLAFEQDFGTWLRGAGGTDPAVTRALARGISAGQIHDLAEAVTRHRGLTPATPGKPPRVPDPHVVFADIAARIGELGELGAHGDPGDAGVVQIRRLQRWLADASGLGPDAMVGHFMVDAPTKVRQAGSRAHWEPPETCAAQMESCRELAAVWAETRRAFGRATLADLLDAVAAFVDAAAVERARTGALFPGDVLPAALELLGRDAAVRRIERDRHALVVVDDVWDVDAASLALVLVLTSLDEDVDDPYRLRPGPGRLLAGGAAVTAVSRSRGADPRLVSRLRDAATTPLRLRTNFRSAPALVAWTTSAFAHLIGDDGDVALRPLPAVPAPQPLPPGDGNAADDAGGAAEAPNADESVPPVGDTTEPESSALPEPEPGSGPPQVEDPNAAVSTNELALPAAQAPAPTILTPEGHAVTPSVADVPGDAHTDAHEPPTSAEEPPAVAPVEAVVAEAPDPDSWGPVVAAWVPAAGDAVVDRRHAEAAAIAGALRILVTSAVPCVRLPDGSLRPAAWSDCAVVLGSTAGLEQYLDALTNAGVAHSRASTGTELLRRQEVADLLSVLRAADDPDDALAVVAALRGLAFGCRDTDLVAAAAAAGAPLRPTADPAEGMPGPVAEALRTLAALHRRRDRTALEVVDMALAATGLREAARDARGADPAHFEAFRALVVGWGGAGTVPAALLLDVDAALRPWLPAVTTPADRPVGVDAVEVLTAAEAVGRQFPVVAVGNMHRLRVPLPAAVPDHSAGRLHLRAGPPDRGFVTEGYDAALARDDEEYLAQRTRLVCTAFSRATDRLVVAVTATAADVDPALELHRRELDRRVARLVVEADPDRAGALRAVGGVTLVPVRPERALAPERGEAVAEDARPQAPAAPAQALADLTGDADPRREALALALSRFDFAADAAAGPAADDELTHLLASVTGSALGDRVRSADRILRRPTVLLDGGPLGLFSDRLDMAFVEGGDVVGVAVTLAAADDAARTRVALGTHALAQAAGLGVRAALLVDARTGTVTELGPADVAAAAGAALSA